MMSCQLLNLYTVYDSFTFCKIKTNYMYLFSREFVVNLNVISWSRVDIGLSQILTIVDTFQLSSNKGLLTKLGASSCLRFLT